MRKMHSALLSVLLCGMLAISSGCGIHISYNPPSASSSGSESGSLPWGGNTDSSAGGGGEITPGASSSGSQETKPQGGTDTPSGGNTSSGSTDPGGQPSVSPQPGGSTVPPASDGLYPAKEHSYIPLSERRCDTFDLDSYNKCCDDFRALWDTTGKEEEFFSRYEEIMTWIDRLGTDSALADYYFYLDPSDEAASELSTELNTQLIDLADQACILIRESLKTGYGSAFREYLGDQVADDFEEYEDMPEGVLELEEQQDILIKEYDSLLEKDDMDPAKIRPIYMELINVNNSIARAYGYDNYVEYVYEGNFMRDFTIEDVNAVSEEIISEFIPLTAAYTDKAIDDRYIYDAFEPCRDSSEERITALAGVIDSRIPELSEALSYMRDCHLYDTDPSDTKQTGAFTTTLTAYGDALLFQNPYGENLDYSSLVHEFGHFNYMFHSPGHYLFQSNALDIEEIHSQGLEMLLCDDFETLVPGCGEGLRQYTMYDLMSSVSIGFAVNEAEYRAYTTPDLTEAKLDAIWDETAAKYSEDDMLAGGGWMEIPHIFEAPFYYISYATSALASLEIYSMEEEHGWEAAKDCYLELTTIDGYDQFRQTLKDAGLDDIFVKGTITELASSLADELDVSDLIDLYKLYFEQLSAA